MRVMPVICPACQKFLQEEFLDKVI